MARSIIPASNVVPFPLQFPRPHSRARGSLAAALVGVSRARATLAPLDQANAISRFDDDQVRSLVGRALWELAEALTPIDEGENSPGN